MTVNVFFYYHQGLQKYKIQMYILSTYLVAHTNISKKHLIKHKYNVLPTFYRFIVLGDFLRWNTLDILLDLFFQPPKIAFNDSQIWQVAIIQCVVFINVIKNKSVSNIEKPKIKFWLIILQKSIKNHLHKWCITHDLIQLILKVLATYRLKHI